MAVTISSALVAFGFAYFQFPAAASSSDSCSASMMLPGVVTIVPVYLVWRQAGLVGSQLPLWAGNLFGWASTSASYGSSFSAPRDVTTGRTG